MTDNTDITLENIDDVVADIASETSPKEKSSKKVKRESDNKAKISTEITSEEPVKVKTEITSGESKTTKADKSTEANFQDFDLPNLLKKSLARMKYDQPTPIQAQAIPLGLSGEDILGSAQTGTGKTAAFSIPVIAKLLTSDAGALILTPTRELATQVMKVIEQMLGKDSGIKTALLIGGDAMDKQIGALKRKARLIVGTPGRVNDHLRRGSLKLNKTAFMVLDETDRMLDMGFGVQIDDILEHMPEQKQTLMFSATLPREIIRLSNKYLNNPKRIAVGSTTNIAENIDQAITYVSGGQKFDVLLEELDRRDGTVIIFVKTKISADKLADKLNDYNYHENKDEDRGKYKADAIHGDLRQRNRERVIKNFRNMKFRILVATDVAARGLDIPHIEHVINYDLPQCPEDYIHRIGRTARAGAKGSALCFISPEDNRKWAAIYDLLKLNDPELAPRGGTKKKESANSRSRSRNGGGGYRNSNSGYGSRRNDSRRGGYSGGAGNSKSGLRRGRYKSNPDKTYDSEGNFEKKSNYRSENSDRRSGSYRGNASDDRRANSSKGNSSRRVGDFNNYRSDSKKGGSYRRGGNSSNSRRSNNRTFDRRPSKAS